MPNRPAIFVSLQLMSLSPNTGRTVNSAALDLTARRYCGTIAAARQP